MYNKENDQPFIYGTRCEKNEQFWIFWGPWQCLGEDFNNLVGPISVRIYHLIYVNLHVKYGILDKKNMVFCRIFWAESRGTKMPTNADLIILETYVQQGK